MNSRFWAAAFTLTGTIVGAGILGLPSVFAKSGFFIGLFWLLVLGGILIYVNLCMSEVCLRTKEKHQLSGYAKKYLGKNAGRLMFFAFAFGIYAALVAYLIGEGQSLSAMFGFSGQYTIYFAMAFWLVLTLLLREGLKGLKRVETWGVLAVILIIFIIFFGFVFSIKLENLYFMDFSYSSLLLPFGIVFFALLGFTSIPELREEIRGKEKELKKAILYGSLIPIVLYILFCIVGVGAFGMGVSEVATLSFGSFAILLGIFTMMTGYFSLSFCLRDSYVKDLKFSKFWTFIFVSVLPLLLYAIISYFNLLTFVKVLGIGGAVSGGLTGILVLWMNYKAKQKGDRKPEYSIPINWFLIVLLSAIFAAGIIIELFF